MIDSDDTNNFIVTVLQIVNYCPQSRLSHNLVRKLQAAGGLELEDCINELII